MRDRKNMNAGTFFQLCNKYADIVSVACVNVAQFSQLVGTDIIFFPFYSYMY